MFLKTTTTKILLHLIALLYIKQTKAQTSKLKQLTPNDVKVDIYENQHITTVEGVRNISWTGETYYAFRGIPYAVPPIGERRFKDPQPLSDLPKYIDARYDGHDCPSTKAANASENCLILNVYTPMLSNTSSLPVLFFIHPGGFYVFSGRSSFLDPAYLLIHPMVVVTFNYRLGALGFSQLGTRDIPGNAGFKDQVLALRWVQRHIKQFGGNADDITLMGYSAGGLSVSLHLVSPMSRGLFHKAIIMSGVVQAQTQLPRGAQMQLMRKQAEVLQCKSFESAQDIVECLGGYSGMEIAATLPQLFDFNKNHPIYLWLPVIEHDFGQERFLLEDPWETLRTGHFSKVPILIGFTDGEFCRSAWDIVQSVTQVQELQQNFLALAPKIFMYEDFATPNKNAIAAVTERLRAYYLTASETMNATRLCDFISDALIRFGAQRFAELATLHTTTFTYKFTYRGGFTNFKYDPKQEVARAEHMDDLMYLFRMPMHHVGTHEADAAMVRVYTKFIYDFMQKSEETTLPTFPIAYALINSTNVSAAPGTFFAADAYDMWRQLFP